MSVSASHSRPAESCGSAALAGRSFKMAFWIVYDHLGTWVVLNLLCMLMITPPLALGLAAVGSGRVLSGLLLYLLSAGVLMPLGMVGVSVMVAEALATREVSWWGLWQGLRRFGTRAIAVGMILALTAGCLAVSAWFYTVRLGGMAPFTGYLLGALSCWLLVLLGPVSLLVWPALVQRKLPALKTLQLTMMVVAANPVVAGMLSGAALLLAGLAALPPLWLVFSIAPVAVLTCSVYELLARKYAVTAAGASVVCRPDQEDDYLNRGLKELLFPWKG